MDSKKKKFAIVAAILVIIYSIWLLSISCKTSAANNSILSHPIENGEIISTAESEPKYAIKGSNAYDITISLKKSGFPEANREVSTIESDEYIFSSSANIDGALLSYTIRSTSAYEVISAEFSANSSDTKVLSNIGYEYLIFSSAFPNDENNPADIQKWLEEKLPLSNKFPKDGGEIFTTNFGDVNIELFGGESVRTVTISANDKA